MGKRMGKPAVLVIERPFQRRFGQGAYNTAATGAADTLGRELAKQVGYGKRIVRVYPASWRAKVLGAPWHMAKRKLVRVHEQKVVRRCSRRTVPRIPGLTRLPRC